MAQLPESASDLHLNVLAFAVVEILDAVCRGTLVAYLCQYARRVIAVV